MKPSLLIASPQMKDPFFERTVVLLWQHDEDGAVGVVVNRPLGHSLAEVLAIADDLDLADYKDQPVAWGGPVEATTGTIITLETVDDEEGWQVDEQLAVTRSQEALIRLIEQGARVLLCLGYAGWGPGQLEAELAKGGWLWTEPSPDLLFDHPLDERWERALASMGLAEHTVWMTPIDE